MTSRKRKVRRETVTARDSVKAFHPGRREHAENYIHVLEDESTRKYATQFLNFIWTGKGKRPRRPSRVKPSRIKEVDAALYAIFATL